MVKRFDMLEEQLDILEKIAKSFPEDSEQYKALENAAFGLMFAIQEQYEDFTEFVSLRDKELTEEQKEFLRKCGISC